MCVAGARPEPVGAVGDDVERSRRRNRAVTSLASGVALACLLGACSVIASMVPSIVPPARPIGVEVANGTTLPITIVVNGVIVRNIGPGDGTREPMAADVLGPMPWTVEARTASGRVLATMTVHPGDVAYQDSGDGHGSARGVGARVDLTCGRLDMWAGPPILGPAPGPGVPGDCVP
jgi:hypothetical protein